MNTIMSTTIVPDIHRHIARKSTVSRHVKNLSLCNGTLNSNNHSSTNFSCNIKLEKDIPQENEQRFVLIADNETEQMNIESNDEEIISSIVENIQYQIEQEYHSQIPNANERPVISADIHQLVNSLLNHLDDECTSNDIPMEETSMLSRSQTDDDIVEIEVSRSCTCQCHQLNCNMSASNPTSEYVLFEQALRQTRQEQQQRSLDNNHLIQTLKRQHQELLTLYHQQIHVNKTDREQQTIQISQHDSQIQTDMTSAASFVQSRPVNSPQQSNGIHSIQNLKSSPTANSRPLNNFLTPIRTTGPSLQQLIPCMTTTTTTLTNKTATIKKPGNSHDLVDLTEEEEDRISTQKVNTLKTPSPAATPTAAMDTARNQQTNRLPRSNPISPASHAFIFRPLPDNSPCDHTIARPQLNITHDNTTVRLTWNLHSTTMESIKNYEIYAYKQSAALAPSDWRKIGSVNSMRLPMAVTLKEFQSNSHYAFAVRAVSITNSIGPFCEPKTIFTGNTLSTVHSSTS